MTEATRSTRAPGAAAARPRRLAPRILLAALVTIGGMLALEAAARLRMHARYGRSTADVYTTEPDALTGLSLPPAGRAFGPVRFNALGFRGPEMPLEKPPGTLRLAFLGGSTTICVEAGPAEATWPHRVAEAIERAHPGLEVDYANAGLQGFTVAQSIRNLKRIAPLEPDVIFIYHATNDLTRDTRGVAIEQGLVTSFGDDRSALARISVAWDLIEKNLRVERRKRRAGAGVGLLDLDAQALAGGFRARMADLVTQAQAIAPLVVVVTFSTRLRPEQSPEDRLEAAETSILYMPYMDPERLLAGFAAYNDASRAAARDAGALLVEAALAVPGDAAHFVDSVHLTPLGCERIAEAISAQVLESDALRELAVERARR